MSELFLWDYRKQCKAMEHGKSTFLMPDPIHGVRCNPLSLNLEALPVITQVDALNDNEGTPIFLPTELQYMQKVLLLSKYNGVYLMCSNNL